MRTCRSCQETKALELFAKNTTGRKDPYRHVCKSCKNAKAKTYVRDRERAKATQKAWRAKNAEKDAKQRRRANWKFKGIDPDIAEQLWNDHNGLCGICQEPIIGQINVDHCHTTGKVRDILCRDCNLGLGYFKDSPRLLMLADSYLKLHSS